MGGFHYHKVEDSKLIEAGFENIVNLTDEKNVIYQLKTTETGRLLGIKINYVFYILGFDPNHVIYK